MDNGTESSSESLRTTVTPYLCVKRAARALEFYAPAFGATEEVRLIDDSGRVSHAEISIGGAAIYLADEFPEINVLSPETFGGSPVLITLQVPDVDALFNQAVASGATVERPLDDGFDDAMRTGKIIDPFGHHWLIITMREQLSSQELERRYTGAAS